MQAGLTREPYWLCSVVVWGAGGGEGRRGGGGKSSGYDAVGGEKKKFKVQPDEQETERNTASLA